MPTKEINDRANALIKNYQEAEAASKSFESRRYSKAKQAAQDNSDAASEALEEFVANEIDSLSSNELHTLLESILKVQDETRDGFWKGTLTGYWGFLKKQLNESKLTVTDIASLVSNRYIWDRGIIEAIYRPNDENTVFQATDVPELFEIVKNDIDYILFWRKFLGKGSEVPNENLPDLDNIIVESTKGFIEGRPYIVSDDDDYLRYVKAYKMLKSDKSKQEFLKIVEGLKDQYLPDGDDRIVKGRPGYQETSTRAMKDLYAALTGENR